MSAAKHGVKAGRAIMSFIIPPVGIVTWGIIKNKRPADGKTYLTIALVSVGLMVIGSVAYAVRNANEK